MDALDAAGVAGVIYTTGAVDAVGAVDVIGTTGALAAAALVAFSVVKVS